MIKTLFSQKLTDISSTDKDGVGRLRYEDDGKIYRYVQNAETTQTLSAGQAVCHTLSDGASATQKVKIPLTANLTMFGGCVMADLPPLYYGYVQCYGESSTALVRASQTTVKAAGVSSYPVNAVTYLDGETTAGTAPTYRRFVTILTAVATTTPHVTAAGVVFIHAI